MHPLISTATEAELAFIANLDYGQGVGQHLAALNDLIFHRRGEFQDGDLWYPYEVIELGANSVHSGHEREFAICSLLVIHAVVSGFDTRTDLADKFSTVDFSIDNMPAELVELLLHEYSRASATRR